RQRALRLGVKATSARSLELHQAAELVAVHAAQDVVFRDAEAPEVLQGQINAAARGVLAHVADDVGELERDTQVLGVIASARIAVAEDFYADEADRRGHPVAVQAQLLEALVARAREIHLDAVDDFLEVTARNRVAAHV